MVSAAPGAARRLVGVRRAPLLLLVNPAATRYSEPEVRAAAATLGGRFRVALATTDGRGHATALAADAARAGCDLVVVVGGDGTVSEAAAGLVGTTTALACLPAGCTNVFARAIGTPRRPLDAAARLASGPRPVPHAVDVGTVNGRPFLCTSGVGLSASMTAAADRAPEGKQSRGQLHFAAAAASELASRYLRRPPRMRVEAGGRSAEGVTAVIQNARPLTYFGPREIRACDAVGLTSGSISLTLLRRARVRDVPPVLLRLLAGGLVAHPQVEGFPDMLSATVTSVDGHPLPLEADGEFLGAHERIEYAVAPRALHVV